MDDQAGFQHAFRRACARTVPLVVLDHDNELFLSMPGARRGRGAPRRRRQALAALVPLAACGWLRGHAPHLRTPRLWHYPGYQQAHV